jgi:hypothetical protein
MQKLRGERNVLFVWHNLRMFGLATSRKVGGKDRSILTQCGSTLPRMAVFPDFTSGICGNTVDGEWV